MGAAGVHCRRGDWLLWLGLWFGNCARACAGLQPTAMAVALALALALVLALALLF